MFITKRKHDEAINAKNADIDGLMKRLKGQEEIADKLHHEVWLLDNEIASLRQQLEPFKRVRGAGGRFVKAQPAYDEVRAQFESECG